MRFRLNLHTVTTIGLAAAGGLVGWHALMDHSVSAGLKDTLTQLGLGALIPVGAPPAEPRAPTPSGATQPAPYSQGCQGTGNLAAMQAANPNIVTLWSTWKSGNGGIPMWQQVQPTLGYASGPYDWSGFVTWLTRNGYPNPGSNPPIDFCRT